MFETRRLQPIGGQHARQTTAIRALLFSPRVADDADGDPNRQRRLRRYGQQSDAALRSCPARASADGQRREAAAQGDDDHRGNI